GQVTGTLKDRARGAFDRHTHFLGDDVGQGSFTQAWRAEDQRVVEGFIASTGRLDEQLHLLANGRLTNVFGQTDRTNRPVLDFLTVARARRGGYQTISFNHLDHSLKGTTNHVFTAQTFLLDRGNRLAGFLRLVAQGDQRADRVIFGGSNRMRRIWPARLIGHQREHRRYGFPGFEAILEF